MDIAEKRIPQDGSFTMAIDDKRIDCRVSTVPTVYGERMVLRILNKDAVPMDLTSLGFEKRQLEDFVLGAQSPHGLQLVTGPTGSGKSTTLYATLSLLRSPKKNILTIEDPVEYKFNGINQVQVKAQVGLTFASALRAFLRQDPDIIMVGEVRDQETAEICLRAALTGHLVLSTLHTNDAVTAISRLQNMGIERFLLASTLRVVEAQRLVRRLCPHCKVASKPTQEMVDKYGFDPNHELFKPKGCPECRGNGYRGRVAIYEVVRITAPISELIQTNAPLPEIRQEAHNEGMWSLLDSGIQKAKNGVTSLEEIVAVTMGEE
jgi:type IV pilus assembly protein PilB